MINRFKHFVAHLELQNRLFLRQFPRMIHFYLVLMLQAVDHYSRVAFQSSYCEQ